MVIVDDYKELIELLRERHLTYVEQVRVADAIESLLAENEQLKHNLGVTEQTMREYQELAAKRMEEIAKYRDALESHGPEGRNYTNLQVVEMRQKFTERINEQKVELAKYRDAPVVAYATTNEEGDLSMLFFDEQEARQYSGYDEPIKLMVKPGE